MRFRLAIVLVTFGLLAAACSSADDSFVASLPDAIPTEVATVTALPTPTSAPTTSDEASGATIGVSDESTFEIEYTTDVVYAQALSHAEWQSDDAEVMDLTLDVFEPVGATNTPRPAMVTIHGGGFNGGQSVAATMTNLGRYFASRGWVVFSINYRLTGDRGTLPSSVTVDPNATKELEQGYAIYTACRDAKAAVRWVRANAETYGIDTERITATGGSAGAITAVGLGVVDESDCKDELTVEEDPTLPSTNLDQSSHVRTVVDFWGSASMVEVTEAINGGESRFDPTDAPMSIIHGTEDPTVPFEAAERLRAEYENNGVPYAFHPLPGAGHGPWRFMVDDNSLYDLAFDFIVDQQALTVE